MNQLSMEEQEEYLGEYKEKDYSIPLEKKAKSSRNEKKSKGLKKKLKLLVPLKYRETYRSKVKLNRDKLNEKVWPVGKRFLTPKEVAHLFMALTGITLSLLMMVMTAKKKLDVNKNTQWLIYISGCMILITHPFIVYNQLNLTILNTLREVMTDLRVGAENIINQNDELTHVNSDLEAQAQSLKEIEEALAGTYELQGTAIDEFLDLVREKLRLDRAYKRVLKADALERILFTLLNCDVDENFRVEGREIDCMIIALKHVEGFEVDEEKFRRMVIDSGGSLHVVFGIIKEWFAVDGIEEASLMEKDETELESLKRSIRGKKDE